LFRCYFGREIHKHINIHHTHTHTQSDEFFAVKVSLVVLVRYDAPGTGAVFFAATGFGVTKEPEAELGI